MTLPFFAIQSTILTPFNFWTISLLAYILSCVPGRTQIDPFWGVQASKWILIVKDRCKISIVGITWLMPDSMVHPVNPGVSFFFLTEIFKS